MSWFKKKTDPLKSREESLNAEIAAIESEIKKLNASLGAPSKTNARKGKNLFGGGAGQRPESGKAPSRSTEEQAGGEPIFETMPRPTSTAGSGDPAESPFAQSQPRSECASRAESAQSGGALSERLRRLGQWFRRSSPSNPRLVNYLAAGSIQGLRPLRYEKRLARNRVILLAVCFALLLWILATLFLPA